MQIKLITLDGDGTLWDFESAMLHALQHAAKLMRSWRLHIDGHDPSVEDLLGDREVVGQEHHGEGLTMERLRWLAFERSLARAGVPNRTDLTLSLYQLFMHHRHDGVRLYDDTLPSLENLRGSRKIALVTNGNTDLRRLGLDGMFDVVISAQTCHFWKPDPRIYWSAITELELQPIEAVHAGDQQRDDIQGARAAGLRTVWVNRRSAPKEAWCEPDAEIRSLLELPLVLDHLEQAGPR